MPNITGQIGIWGSEKQYSTASGAFTINSGSMDYGKDHLKDEGAIYDFDASRSNSIYGNSSTVQPPALTMRYYIKY